MKIRKLYISSFAKIKELTVDFNDNLTTIKEENGYGKSTIANFIKCMFYGLSGARRSLVENDRMKFKPWNSTSKFGGYIIVEKNGKDWKIERFFGNKESEDTVSVIEMDTGKSYNTEDLGRKFFQIDEEGYFSTTYFSQKNFEVKSSASITAKYNETYDIQDTELFQKALVKLEERKKEYKKTGGKGLIEETKNSIRQIKSNLEEIKNLSSTIKNLKNEELALEKEVELLQEKIKKVSDKLAISGKKEAILIKKKYYDDLLKEMMQLKATSKGILDKFNGDVENAKRVKDYFVVFNEFRELSIKIEQLENDVLTLRNMQTAKEQTKKPIKKDKNFAFIVGGFSLIFLGFILFFVNMFAGAGVVVAGVLTLILSFIIKPKEKNDEEADTIKHLINNKIQERDSCANLLQEKKQVLEQYLARFNIVSLDFALALKEIENQLKTYNDNEFEIQKISRELENLKNQKEIFENYNDVEDIQSLRENLSLLNEEYSFTTKNLSDKKSRISALEIQVEKQREMEEEVVSLTEELAESEREYELLEKTLDFLKQADERLKIKYRKPLEDSLNKFVKYIDEKISANIDIDLKVTINENGMAMDTEYYSKGYKNLFDICKRFALVDVLFTKDKPFVILDDPFVNLDEEKLDKALKLIKSLSDEYQIIYLICHQSRKA